MATGELNREAAIVAFRSRESSVGTTSLVVFAGHEREVRAASRKAVA